MKKIVSNIFFSAKYRDEHDICSTKFIKGDIFPTFFRYGSHKESPRKIVLLLVELLLTSGFNATNGENTWVQFNA